LPDNGENFPTVPPTFLTVIVTAAGQIVF